MSKLEKQVMKDLGKQLTSGLNQMFDEEYKMAIEKRQPRGIYDINTETYRSYTTGGIETWHAKGAEHHLVQQLEQRLATIEQNHKRDMTNLANQVISMNNAVEARVQHINGFYTWLIQTYPETVAQYKALLDLKRLSEGEEE